MDKECVYVQACVGESETWEASCLCRSAKQKEPLTIHPHISYFSFVSLLILFFFFDISIQYKSAHTKYTLLGFKHKWWGEWSYCEYIFCLSFHPKLIIVSTEVCTIVKILHTYTLQLFLSLAILPLVSRQIRMKTAFHCILNTMSIMTFLFNGLSIRTPVSL